MNEGSDTDTDHQIGQDPSHQILRVGPGVADAVFPCEVDLDRCAALALECPDVVLDVTLHAELADDEPADHCDGEAGCHVDKGDARTEEAPEQHEGYLVDHR